MKVRLKGIEGFLCAARCGGHQVRMDQPEDYGGKNAAPEPVALLGAALAGCVYSSLKAFLERRGLRPEEVEVEVEMEKAREPARIGAFRVRLRLPRGVEKAWIPAVRRAVLGCSVTGTLVHPAQVELEILEEG